MELYQLRTFVAVAELGHLTKAAESLHISQPAVSAQVRALEQQLGVELFVRGPGGMTLTPAGSHLLPLAEKVLAAVQALRSEVQALKGEVQGTLRVGTVSDPGYLKLGEFLSRVVERHPLINIEMHKETSGEAIEQLRSGKLDASFFFGDALPPQTEGLRLADMTYRVIAPMEWRGRVVDADWRMVSSMPWVMMPENSTYQQMLGEAFAQRGLAQPQKVVEADQASVITDLVASGVGLSLAREEVALAGRDAGRWVIWEPARLRTVLWFVYPSSRAQEAPIIALLKVLKEVWDQEGGPKTPSGSKPEPLPSPIHP
jgi:DNA-binding transcriptional LysR family regulator